MDHMVLNRDDPPSDIYSGAYGNEHAEGASHQREEWLGTVLKNTSGVIMVLKSDGTLRYVSPAIESVMGYLPEDVVGTVSFDYVHPEDRAFVAESFAEILKTSGVHTPVEFRAK